MTPAQQRKFYFPAWTAAVKANGWRMVQKRLAIPEARLTGEGRQVVAFGRQIAAAQQRGPIIDDLRHGAHILALGRDKSSAALTNAEVDRVVTLFRLLTDPEDLDARLKWDAYQRGEDPGAVKRREWVIESVPEAIARKISEDMLGTRAWEFQSAEDKRILARRIAQYKQSKAGSQYAGSQCAGQRAVHCPPSTVHRRTDSDDPDWTV